MKLACLTKVTSIIYWINWSVHVFFSVQCAYSKNLCPCVSFQTDVVQRLANYVESLRDELQGMYEPLQESPANITVLKTRLGKGK